MLTLSNPVSMFSVFPVIATICLCFSPETRATGCRLPKINGCWRWTHLAPVCRRPVTSTVTATTQSPQHPAALSGHLTCYQEYNSRYEGAWRRSVCFFKFCYDLKLRISSSLIYTWALAKKIEKITRPGEEHSVRLIFPQASKERSTMNGT